MTTLPPERSPVIVGVGDVIDKVKDPSQARHPLQLLDAVLRAADADAGGGWLERVDSIDIVNLMSWSYDDLPGQLCEAIGRPRGIRAVHGPVGGEAPLRHLQELALRIMAGESTVGVVCGAEALGAVMRAAAARTVLPWPPKDSQPAPPRAHPTPPEGLKYGLRMPVDVYPLYENACRARWRQGFDEAQDESAFLWSEFSRVAAENPYAWIREAQDPERIRTPGPDNRPIAWPYGKLMVANNAVNQGAAVIVTSLGAARAAGIPDDRLVFVWDGCGADEPRSILARDVYWRSPVQETVLTRTLARNGLERAGLTELYSCFPCVPKMARRILGLGPEAGPFTVAGGLTFFGAPANAYMVHAATAMVRALRDGRGATGLLYGQGEFVTKHHALVLGRGAPPDGVATGPHSVQPQADAARGPVPALHEGYEGAGTVETYTVFFDRDGGPKQGVVIGLNGAGERFVARIPGDAAATLARFTDPGREPVGSAGTAIRAGDGLCDWHAA